MEADDEDPGVSGRLRGSDMALDVVLVAFYTFADTIMHIFLKVHTFGAYELSNYRMVSQQMYTVFGS